PYRPSQPARMGKLLGEDGLREYLRCYYAQVTMVDWCVGRILDELERLGLADRTLVIFTSDHGDMQAAHGMMGKSTPAYYDEILRVPLLMRLPGVIAKGKVCDALASSPDLPATILDLLGAEPLPGAHGTSLRPALAGKDGATDAVFAERGTPGQRSCSRMVRTRTRKLAVFGTGRREFFDLESDPEERHDLAEDPSRAAEIQALTARLAAHMKRIGDPAHPSLFERTS
ncbi:sulfatase-like hydrolase/transferase, partial [bacterium]|nr:sulfatase-like hydrolase/transferase [bacterium]